MVISIAIGYYEENQQRQIKNVGGYLEDLVGIDNDIKSVVKLFGSTLNYDIFPSYNFNDYIKQYWTAKEIMDLFKKQSQIFEDNIAEFDDENGEIVNGKYDGLVVIISCHGIRDHIISSDYEKIDRTAIHRLFSLKRPKCRQFPRLFIFDCCSGSQQKDSEWRCNLEDAGDDNDSDHDDDDDNENLKKFRKSKIKCIAIIFKLLYCKNKETN